jgi:hypothetical protein
MITLPSVLSYLMTFSGVLLTVLAVLVVYGNVLDSREDEQIYLNKTEERMLAGFQPALIRRMHGVARAITLLATVAGISLVASAGIWVYMGLFKS